MSKESPEIKSTHKASKQGRRDSDQIVLTTPTNKREGFIKVVLVTILSAGIFFFAQLLPIIVVVTFLRLIGNSQDQIEVLFSENATVQLAMAACIALVNSYIIWQFLKWRGHNPKNFLLLNKKLRLSEVGESILIYGVYFITLVCVSVIVALFTPIDINQSQDLGVAAATGLGLLPIFIMLVVLPPIYEEILFRGFLFKYISGFGGRLVGYALTSVLFGIAHLEFGNLNWIAAIDTLIFSGFLIYISQKHQSLYSAIILHAVKNCIAFFALFVF